VRERVSGWGVIMGRIEVPGSARRLYAKLMLFAVLGPLEVRVDSRQLMIKGVKERRLR